jgi:hypothetical protein
MGTTFDFNHRVIICIEKWIKEGKYDSIIPK